MASRYFSRSLITIAALFITSAAFAQKKNFYYLKNNGKYVHERDSADYYREVSVPDSGSTLYNVSEYYINGKPKLVGKSVTVDPPRYDGQCVTFFPSGTKKTTANFSKGNHAGPEYNYYPNGKIYLVTAYADDGQPDGPFREFSIKASYDSLGTALAENGNGYAKILDRDFKQVVEEGPLKDAKRDGEWKGLDTRLKLTFNETYNQGQLITGTAKYDDGITAAYAGSRGTMPLFKGGTPGFGQYLGQNLRYPDPERKNGVEGRVILSFVVEKDGTVRDVKVARSVSEGLDEEALRVIRKSPKWIAGTQFGRPVKVNYAVPVNFKLQY